MAVARETLKVPLSRGSQAYALKIYFQIGRIGCQRYDELLMPAIAPIGDGRRKIHLASRPADASNPRGRYKHSHHGIICVSLQGKFI